MTIMTTQKVIYAKFLQDIRSDTKYDEFLQKINPAKNSLPEIFDKFWQLPQCEQINFPDGNLDISKKGETESEHFRNVGNRLYKEKKLDKALIAYNYAILSAPHPVEDFHQNDNEERNYSDDHVTEHPGYECLSYAYANRSVLMVDMSQYQKALEDILHSVKYGYPMNKRYKLVERKCKCLIFLARFDEARLVLERLALLMKSIDLGKKENNLWKNNIEKLRIKCTDNLNIGTDQKQNSNEEKNEKFSNLFYRGPHLTPAVHNARESYPSVSQSVKVRYSKTKGRYLVATEDIEPGEVLLLEESFCNTLDLGDALRNYCNYCLKSAPTPLPCSTCSLVVFCSTTCRSASLCPGGCHASECFVLPSLVAMDTDVDGMLVLRSLLPMSVPHLINLCLKYKKSNASQDEQLHKFNESSDDLSEDIFTPPSGDEFDCMHNLEGNICNRPMEDILEASISAVLLVKIILSNIDGYFKSNTQINSIKQSDELDKKLLGGLVLRLLFNFQCNAHCIKELQVKPDELVILSKLAIIGYGVYCNLSLVNHSCNPNVLHSTSGKTKFLYAVSCIRKGEEICDSYGERYVSHRLEDRQESIEKTYHFKCDCIACLKDWPIFNELPQKFSLKCLKCSNVIDKETSSCNSCQLHYSVKKAPDTRNKKAKKNKPQAPYDAMEIRNKISTAWETYNKVSISINKGIIPGPSDIAKLRVIIKLLDKYSIHPNRPLVQVQEFMMRYYDLQAAVARV